MKYLVLALSILASLGIGYEVGTRKEAALCEVNDIGSKLIRNEILTGASRSLYRETVYYELTQLEDKEKVIELIKNASLEGIEKELDFLLKFRSSWGSDMSNAVQSRIENAQAVLNEINKK